MSIFLETKRLIIKPPSLQDIDKLLILDSDPEVMRYIGSGIPRSSDESRLWYEKSVNHYKKYGFSFGLVFEKDTGEFVGRGGINYNAYDDTQPDIEIGYRLLKKFWNKGYATELASALIQWGFNNLDIDKLCGFSHPDNKASRHVLEKVGMHLVGLDKYADEEIVRYEIIKPVDLTTLKRNMSNIFGKKGETWLLSLPSTVDKLCSYWGLSNVTLVHNMTYNYVAKVSSHTNTPYVLKIGCDSKSLTEEMTALKCFNGNGSIQLIDHHAEYNALLLQQALPGISLKSFYPNQSGFVMDCYINTMNKLHKMVQPNHHHFPHIQDWLMAIDHVSSDMLPHHLLNKAISLKTNLINSLEREILLHGDLHHDNILKHEEQWLAIDPKGIIGEEEFEIAAFDFMHQSEIHNVDAKDLFFKRIELITNKSNLNYQRIKDWVFVRLILSAAWSIEDKGDPSFAIKLAEFLF